MNDEAIVIRDCAIGRGGRRVPLPRPVAFSVEQVDVGNGYTVCAVFPEDPLPVFGTGQDLSEAIESAKYELGWCYEECMAPPEDTLGAAKRKIRRIMLGED